MSDLRGSITAYDANPTGINQYSGAASAAEKASGVANAKAATVRTVGARTGGSPSRSLRQAALSASKAHQAAHEAHMKAGALATNRDDRSHHEIAATQHQYYAKSFGQTALRF
jgi:hypothetical protein